MRGNVAKEAQGIRLMPSFLVGTEIRQGASGERLGLLQAAGAPISFAQDAALHHLYWHDATR